MSGFEITIKDSSTGRVSRVTNNGQLFTQAESLSAGAYAATKSRQWSIGTGDIECTSASVSALIYLKYTGTKKLIINNLSLTTGDTTGGSSGADVVYNLIQNPTAGTIVSTATAAEVINRNFSGVAGSLSGDKFKGVEGATITDGTAFGEINTTSGANFQSFDLETRPIVLENGNSFGITFDPPASNTSQTVRAFIFAYETEVI